MFKLFRFSGVVSIFIVLACNPAKQERPLSTKELPADLMHLYQKAVRFVKQAPDSAFWYFQKVEEQSRALQADYGIGLALSGMGNLAAEKGDMEQAMIYYKSALPYYQKVRDSAALPSLYTNIGAAYNLQGKYPEARKNYQLALDYFLSQAPGDKTLGLLYGNLSDLYINIGEYGKALHYAERADDFFHQNALHPPPFTKGLILINKADAYMHLQRYEKAFAVLQACVSLAQNEHVLELEPVVLSTLGELMLRQNKNAMAVNYLEDALRNQSHNVYYGYILPRYRLGSAYYRLREYNKARDVLLAAFKKSAENGQLNESIKARTTLAQVYRAQNDYRNAFLQQQEVLELKDRLMGQEKINAINEIEIKYRTAQKDKELAEKKLQISRQENKLNKKNIWIGGISLGVLLLGSVFISRNRVMQQKRMGQDKQIRILEQEQELLKRELEIRQLESIVEGEEKERVRIGRDLHDGIVSQLMAVRLHFKGALQNAQNNIPNLSDFQSTLQYLDDATKELRKTAHNLMPETVLQGGLMAALTTFCKKMEAASGIKIYVQLYGVITHMDRKIELSLYRIVQELVQNALKHAACTYILVQMDATDDLLFITIEDNGIGFATSAVERNEGMGLKSIHTRIKALNGKIDFISKPGTGVTVNMEFNLLPGKEGSIP